ncbi:MAG: DNA primase [Bacillota bacterium]|nr:DNA primase [Bacillota bacterium]
MDRARLVEEVKSRNDIVEVIGQYVHLKPQGKDFVGLCPFHGERTPSFHVSPEKQLFYCFGCHAGGDVIRFVQLKENLAFQEALGQLAQRVGLTLEEGSKDTGRQKLYEALAQAQAFYRRMLAGPRGEMARRYLASRQVDEGAAERFGLGYAPTGWDALWRHLRAKGFSPEVLQEAGLTVATRSGKTIDRFRHRLMFPIWDEKGRVVGFGGRLLEGEGPKYLNSPDSPVFKKKEIWYGWPLARSAVLEKGQALVVEGYMDCLSLHAHGFTHAVASLGTSLTEEQAQKLARLTDQAILAYDADLAGQGAGERGWEKLQAAGVGVRLLFLPEGQDPDDVLRRQGKEAWERLMAEAVPLEEFAFQQIRKGVNLRTLEGKRQAVKRLAPLLARERDVVRRDYYMQRYAQWLSLSDDAFRQILQTYQAESIEHKGKISRNTKESLGADRTLSTMERRKQKAEELILGLLVQGKAAGEGVWSKVRAEDFRPGPFRELAEVLQGGQDPFDHSWRLSEEAQELLGRLAFLEVATESPISETVRDCINTMQEFRQRQRLQEIQLALLALERQGREAPRDLILEQAQLLSSLKRTAQTASREARL